MRLIWTYDYEIFIDDLANSKKNILLNYYIHSINIAKKLGYYTIMYCARNSIKYFENIIDELHIIDNETNTPLYDYIKFSVLTTQEDDNYCLIDGDVILHYRLPEFKHNITFDAYEIHFNNTIHWQKDYEETLTHLTDLGIGNVIPEWENKRIPIMNCGILNIKGKELRNLYVERWNSYNKFVINNISKLQLRNLTNIGAQYLLTLIRDYYEISSEQLSPGFGKRGLYYTHDAGDKKYLIPLVSKEPPIISKNKLNLI